MCGRDQTQELPVTFRPELYLQRRGWVLDVMRRESIAEVLDIGCGEGELLACLSNPAPWLAPPPPGVLPPAGDEPAPALSELHKDILHPTRIVGLDVSRAELAGAIERTRPPSPGQRRSMFVDDPVRWEPLEVKIWEGSVADVNPGFVGVECIVSMEVVEHLPEDVLQTFAPVIFGAYHPRLVLLTTPSYTFNARFTAPDAPPEARSGWPDPTRRTQRIFRHHDHKFEWTVEEFAQWCNAVADEWGYEVELGGVGKACEVDEWGRDAALGWASQVATFKRRGGEEWATRRAKRVDDSGICRGAEAQGRHKLLATHQHPAHEAARRPEPLHTVADLVIDKMSHFRETSIALRELWFQNDVATACGGWLEWLARAIETHDSLALHKPSAENTAEWLVHLHPSLYHLAAQVDSPPDTDEVADPWDPYDEDLPWKEDTDEVLVISDENAAGGCGREEQTTQWDKGTQSIVDDTEWGAPQGTWDCGGEWM